MSDFTRFRNAVSIIEKGNLDKAWAALYWVFCSTDLEPDGFFQTLTRLGRMPERVKMEMLNKYPVARLFYYGPEADNDDEADDDEEQEVC